MATTKGYLFRLSPRGKFRNPQAIESDKLYFTLSSVPDDANPSYYLTEKIAIDSTVVPEISNSYIIFSSPVLDNTSVNGGGSMKAPVACIHSSHGSDNNLKWKADSSDYLPFDYNYTYPHTNSSNRTLVDAIVFDDCNWISDSELRERIGFDLSQQIIAPFELVFE